MTALKEFQRLETTALWRATQEEQRRDVVVSLGDLTLIITDMNGRALAHWSLDALCRANPGKSPACYYPRGNPGETLEITEPGMVTAITQLIEMIDRSQPRPGRLRRVIFWGMMAAMVGFLVFGLPRIIHQYALSVLPPISLREAGEQILAQTRKTTGELCENAAAQPALNALSQRLVSGGDDGAKGPRLVVVSNGIGTATALPGGIILINRSLIENHDGPDLLAGYLIAAQVRAKIDPPMQAVLDVAGLPTTIRLMSGGNLPARAAETYVRQLLVSKPFWPPAQDMLARFETLRISPVAFGRAVADQAPASYGTITLVGAAQPVLNDADWLRLQTICDQ